MATIDTPAVRELSPVAANFRAVRERIAQACRRSGRNPHEVTLVGVTKTVAVASIRAALDGGLTHVAENRLQEAIPKMRALADRAPTWHYVGHLQTNKARRAAELFDVIESVDSLRLACELDAAAAETGRDLKVYVQVDFGEEPSKHGVRSDLLPDLVSAIDELPCIEVVGLMSVPPRRERVEESRADFRWLRAVFEATRERHAAIVHLSMGMSADFEVAIEEGATEVRVGTALFGGR